MVQCEIFNAIALRHECLISIDDTIWTYWTVKNTFSRFINVFLLLLSFLMSYKNNLNNNLMSIGVTISKSRLFYTCNKKVNIITEKLMFSSDICKFLLFHYIPPWFDECYSKFVNVYGVLS